MQDAPHGINLVRAKIRDRGYIKYTSGSVQVGYDDLRTKNYGSVESS